MKWKHGRKVALSDVQSNVINLLTYHQNKFHSIINRAENIYLAIGKYTFTTQMALTRFRLFKHIRGWYFPPLLELYSVEDVEEERHKINAITLNLSLPINPFKRHPWRWAIIKYLHCSHALENVGRKPRQQIRHNHKTTVVNLLLLLEWQHSKLFYLAFKECFESKLFKKYKIKKIIIKTLCPMVENNAK